MAQFGCGGRQDAPDLRMEERPWSTPTISVRSIFGEGRVDVSPSMSGRR